MSNRIAEISELLKENENDVFLNYALGLEYLSLSDYPNAIIQFEKCIRLDETYTPAYYQCGMAYYQHNEKQEALDILKKGLQQATQKKHNKETAEFKSLIINIENDLI